LSLLMVSRVASRYRQLMSDLGVKVSLPKSLVSMTGAAEFANQFLVRGLSVSCIAESVIGISSPFRLNRHWGQVSLV
jgi:hypothetical protein